MRTTSQGHGLSLGHCEMWQNYCTNEFNFGSMLPCDYDHRAVARTYLEYVIGRSLERSFCTLWCFGECCSGRFVSWSVQNSTLRRTVSCLLYTSPSPRD
eukprot:143824-Alexandrium_andersonii.AAC.1